MSGLYFWWTSRSLFGDHKKYYENGQIKEHYYVKNKINYIGERKEWYENGQIYQEYLFSDTGKILEHKRWRKDGEPIS